MLFYHKLWHLSLNCSGVIPGSGYIGSPEIKLKWLILEFPEPEFNLPMCVLNLTGKPPKQGRRGSLVFSNSQRKKWWPKGRARKASLEQGLLDSKALEPILENIHMLTHLVQIHLPMFTMIKIIIHIITKTGADTEIWCIRTGKFGVCTHASYASREYQVRVNG